MEELNAQLADLKLHLQNASSKDEAISVAFSAAQLCIDALKLAPTKTDRADLKSQASSLLDEAESIKANSDWQPSPVSQAASAPVLTFGSLQSKTTFSESPATVGKASASRVRELPEPIMTREIPTKEQILLLRSSKLNDAQFPPWKGPPADVEFERPDGAPPFIDHVLELSVEQQKLFKEWARAEDALPPPAWRLSGDPATGLAFQVTSNVDLVQDAASDCSVVASMCAAAARGERGHALIISKSIWPRSKDQSRPILSPNGKYILKLNFNGCWRKVTIDDRLPVSQNTRLLHVVDRKNPASLWPALVEKAYLKIRGGYDFPGSSSCSDLWVFTGWIPEQIFLQADDLVPNQLWRRIYKAFEYGDVLVTVGTGNLGSKGEKAYGLVSRHNYAVMDMKEVDGERMFLVKNPWLTGTQWKADSSSLQTQARDASGSQISASQSDNELPAGSKWILFEQVMQRFESIFLNWNPGLFSYRQDVHFIWDAKSDAHLSVSLNGNPQFSFVAEGDGVVWFLLSRHFRDERLKEQKDGSISCTSYHPVATGELPQGYISLAIYDKGGNTVLIDEGCLERSPFVNTPQTLMRWEVKKGCHYTVVATQQELPPFIYTFSLTAFASTEMSLGHAVEQHSHAVEIKDAWKSESSGGSQLSARYYENPQFRLTVSGRTSLTATLETPAGDIPIHVAIVHGRGERVFTVRNRDVVAQAESYNHGLVIAKAQNLDPGTYTIICSTFDAGQLADFTLRINATCKCELKKIPNDGAGLFISKLNPVTFGTENLKMAANLIPRRLLKLNIVVNFKKSRLRSLSEASETGQSPFRLTLEQGRGPDKVVVHSSNSGDFTDAHTIRVDAVDLFPAMVKPRDLWLVVERMAPPNPGFEEVYDMEFRMDVPNGVVLGQWRGWDD